MKRWTVVIMAAMSLALATAPAMAKPKPPDPPPLPETAEVTMTLIEGADGLAGVLQMEFEASRNGKVVEYFARGDGESSSADLALQGFEEFLDQGLHPGLAILDPNDCGLEPLYEGIFWLKFDRIFIDDDASVHDGELAAVVWHFDMDVSFNAGRRGCSWVVNERYTISSVADRELLDGEEPLSYSDGVVSGTFELHLYDADAVEPHVDLGRTQMQFGLAIDG